MGEVGGAGEEEIPPPGTVAKARVMPANSRGGMGRAGEDLLRVDALL